MFHLCPKQGPKIEGGCPTQGVYFSFFFCPKQGQGLKPLAAPLYPTMDQVPPPPPGGYETLFTLVKTSSSINARSFTQGYGLIDYQCAKLVITLLSPSLSQCVLCQASKPPRGSFKSYFLLVTRKKGQRRGYSDIHLSLPAYLFIRLQLLASTRNHRKPKTGIFINRSPKWIISLSAHVLVWTAMHAVC